MTWRRRKKERGHGDNTSASEESVSTTATRGSSLIGIPQLEVGSNRLLRQTLLANESHVPTPVHISSRVLPVEGNDAPV